MSIKKSNIPKESTVEGLIEGLDQRGLLVFLVLLGQQSMKILSEEHVNEVTKPGLLLPREDRSSIIKEL